MNWKEDWLKSVVDVQGLKRRYWAELNHTRPKTVIILHVVGVKRVRQSKVIVLWDWNASDEMWINHFR
jgi:hypothetical protein